MWCHGVRRVRAPPSSSMMHVVADAQALAPSRQLLMCVCMCLCVSCCGRRVHAQARITQAGGFVFWNGGHRVMGVLSMSRAIGDLHLKKYGVIPTPEVRHAPSAHEIVSTELRAQKPRDVTSLRNSTRRLASNPVPRKAVSSQQVAGCCCQPVHSACISITMGVHGGILFHPNTCTFLTLPPCLPPHRPPVWTAALRTSSYCWPATGCGAGSATRTRPAWRAHASPARCRAASAGRPRCGWPPTC